MGREIRRVPVDWEHPKDENGRFEPLFDECYEDACKKWYSDCAAANGKAISSTGKEYWYHEYHGNPPTKDCYRDRSWTPEEATHIQMYETVSEGTPVSPVFATGEELINYLCENGDFWDQKRRTEGRSSMPCQPWSRQNAESFVKSGWAISGVIANGKIYGPSEQGELKIG